VFANNSAIGCITDLTSSTEIEHFQTTLDRRSILTVHQSPIATRRSRIT
jgi:hypothetical protein